MSKTKKLSKVLALILMLALVIGILPMGAMASNTPVYVRFFDGASQIGSTVYVTAANDNVYSAVTAAISANTSISTNDCVVDAFGIHKIKYNDGTNDIVLEPSATESDNDTILYTVDDKLGYTAVGQMPVSAGSVITVFYAQNYSTTLYASIVPDGAATSGYAIAADNGDTVYYRVATTTVDFANVNTTIHSTVKSQAIDSSTTAVTDTVAVTDYTVIPAYKPVVASSSTILSSWKSSTLAAYGALTTAQQGQITSGKYAAASANNATMTQVNALAYEVAPFTRENSKDLKSLSFSQGGSNMSIWQTSSGIGYFDPAVTAYELETATGNVTISAAALSSGASISYSSNDSHMTVNNGVISFSATGTYTLTVTVTNSGTKSYTVSITYAAAATSGVPGGVCGYLPVGQFARGNGWGAICTDGTNTGTTKKFLSGYVGTGVSLGLLGGYVQFDLGTNKYITDTATHPYGVDFIVYGNPSFSGNPEAGAVMVSEDGKVWYNLAGSLHYDSNTVKYMNISYMKIDANNTVITDSSNTSKTFSKGIWYSTDYVPTDLSTDFNDKIVAANWTQFLTGTAWWPEYTSESYGNVWTDAHLGDHTDTNTTGDVYWNRTNTAHEVITYMGVTRVKDDAEMGLSGDDATNYYRFGYADVRAIGSSYGTAVNPYATLPAAAAGGDGFDLAWAVDDDGKPVDMTGKHIRFIRVYSAVLYNTGIFGETSAEVCGLYIATGSGSSTISSNLIVKVGDTQYVDAQGSPFDPNSPTPNHSTITIPYSSGMTIKLESSDTYLFVNGEPVTRTSNVYNITSVSSGDMYQIITQSGSESPYIVLLKVS